MSALVTDTYTRHTITCDQLRPGDIVLTATGDRWYAAFDVEDRRNGYVQVWTTTSDQAKGRIATELLPKSHTVTVARRDGGPRTTTTHH
jgi:hypothetical protein